MFFIYARSRTYKVLRPLRHLATDSLGLAGQPNLPVFWNLFNDEGREIDTCEKLPNWGSVSEKTGKPAQIAI